MIPLCARAASGFTSGTTSGTSGSIRNAELSSITRVPLAATWGANSRASSVETEKNAMSRPRHASTVNSSTASDSPANVIRDPTDRAEAYSRSCAISSGDCFEDLEVLPTDHPGRADDPNLQTRHQTVPPST